MTKAKAKRKVQGNISLRLDKSLLEDLKLVAKLRGMPYQSLLKQILDNYIKSERQHGDGRIRSELVER